MKYFIFIFLILSACDPLESQYKCDQGILYMKSKGAWIQTLLYEKNKCLPLDENQK